MKQKPIIAPSILSADFSKLGREVESVIEAGAEWIHFDVMDNHYVPNLTVGPMVCQSLRKAKIKVPIDVHLMASPVDSLIENFAEAGANIISFHPEASMHIDRNLQQIRDLGCQAGLVFNPGTPLNSLEYVLDKIDVILIMSVNPGFGGQKFIPTALKKIASVRRIIDKSGKHIRLEVDGGVNSKNIRDISEAGADTFVAGSAIFDTKNYRKSIFELKQNLFTETDI